MNQYLAQKGSRVDDLYEDLRDGVVLIQLLEILSGDKIVSINNFWPKILYFFLSFLDYGPLFWPINVIPDS